MITPPKVAWAAIAITDKCNFRCGMCDYWRVKAPAMLAFSRVEPLAGVLIKQGLEGVTITGGEPLTHPEWGKIARLFVERVRVNLCTNGSLIAAHASEIAKSTTSITVSIDGASEATFRRVRGIDALRDVWTQMERIKRDHAGLDVFVKMTLQRDNVFEIRLFLEKALAQSWITGVGFTIPDFSMMGFKLANRTVGTYLDRVIPAAKDLDRIEALFESILLDYGSLYASKYIYEGNLRRYLQRFRFLRELSSPPAFRNCLIPREVITIHPDARISACYFQPNDSTVETFLEKNGTGLNDLLTSRQQFDSRSNAICQKCDQLLFTNSRLEIGTGVAQSLGGALENAI